MHRRSFLMSAVALPGWMAAATRGQEAVGPQPPTSAQALPVAWQEARRSGRPLLVLVIPSAEGDEPSLFGQTGKRQLHGLVWAQLFLYGADDVLADLALCVVACATLAEVRRLLPYGVGATLPLDADPAAVLVEPDAEPGPNSVATLDLELARIQRSGYGKEEVALYERQVTERVARVGAAVQALLVPDAAALATRAARARRAVTDLPELDLTAEPDDAMRRVAERAPAIVRAAAERSPHRGQLLTLLADTARATAGSPSGAVWGEYTGCGTRLEGLAGTAGMFDCGMGHAPKMGRRFLHFYTAS